MDFLRVTSCPSSFQAVRIAGMEFTHSSESEVTESRRGEFVISTDRARIDLDVIHGFLTNCYWAKGIPRDVVARSIEHSLCFGIYHEVGEKSPLLAKPARSGAPQVGFARVISDSPLWHTLAMCSCWNRIAAAG